MPVCGGQEVTVSPLPSKIQIRVSLSYSYCSVIVIVLYPQGVWREREDVVTTPARHLLLSPPTTYIHGLISAIPISISSSWTTKSTPLFFCKFSSSRWTCLQIWCAQRVPPTSTGLTVHQPATTILCSCNNLLGGILSPRERKSPAHLLYFSFIFRNIPLSLSLPSPLFHTCSTKSWKSTQSTRIPPAAAARRPLLLPLPPLFKEWIAYLFHIFCDASNHSWERRMSGEVELV